MLCIVYCRLYLKYNELRAETDGRADQELPGRRRLSPLIRAIFFS